MLKRCFFATIAAIFPFAAIAANIEAGPFSTTFESDGDLQTLGISPNSVAGFCDPFDGFGCDGGVLFSNDTSVFVDWVDGDSFDVGFFGGGASSFSIKMAGLELTDGSDPLDFDFSLSSSAPFNDLNIDDFLASASNPTGAPAPTVSTLLTVLGDGTFDLELSVSAISGQLLGDGPTMRFDVVVQDVEGPEVIPLPAGGLLLLSGLAVFGAVRQRSKS